VVVVVVISSQDNFSSTPAFALNCSSSRLLGLMSSGGCFAATVVLFGACPGGWFAAQDGFVGWMLCHRLIGRMLCRYVATWVDTLPPLVLAYALPPFSPTLVDALPHWSRSLRLLSLGIFGDGVSLFQVQFLASLVRVVGLGVSSLPFLLLLLLVVVVVTSVPAGCVLVIPFFSVSLSLVLRVLCWPSLVWLHQILFVNCFLLIRAKACSKKRDGNSICYGLL
jgi:hypothetical protein